MDMESRRSRRVIIDLPAEIIAGDKRFAGSIENLSEEGVYVVTPPTISPGDFTQDSLLELRFHLPSGEKQVLKCKVKWSYQTPPHGYTNSIGLEIIEPPLTYKETLKTL